MSATSKAVLTTGTPLITMYIKPIIWNVNQINLPY